MSLANLRRKVVGSFDWQIVFATLLLCAIGLVVVYSAGFNPETGRSLQMERQAVSMALGLGAFLVASLLSSTFWRRWAIPLYVVGCVLLVAVLGIGSIAGGAQRWLTLGGVRVQPSEFMKFGLILILARICSVEQFNRGNASGHGATFSQLIIPAVLTLIPVILVIKQPDLGTGLCLLLVGGSIVLLAGVQNRILVRLAIIALLAAYPAWHMLREYQRNRILTFVSPESDPLGTGYHAMQSKIAVGSGATLGKGFLEGTQTQLRFLPEQTTDFIYSVLAEEWGFVGSVFVVLIYAFLIFRLLAIANRCNERFPAFVVVGVAALIFWQATINIGMVIGIMPVVGITLPLMSFGGSSVVTVMACLGVASGVGARRLLFS